LGFVVKFLYPNSTTDSYKTLFPDVVPDTKYKRYESAINMIRDYIFYKF